MQRRHLLQAAAAATLAGPAALRAQGAWPSQPVRLLIAFPAGGPTDITMRALAENAAKLLGQPVVVENRPGAGGTLPAQAMRCSIRRDGGPAILRALSRIKEPPCPATPVARAACFRRPFWA